MNNKLIKQQFGGKNSTLKEFVEEYFRRIFLRYLQSIYSTAKNPEGQSFLFDL